MWLAHVGSCRRAVSGSSDDRRTPLDFDIDDRTSAETSPGLSGACPPRMLDEPGTFACAPSPFDDIACFEGALIVTSDTEQRIPAVLHYCWFGGKPLPPQVEESLASWRAVMPEYTVRRWDEESWDVGSNRFASRNHDRGKWAFVSDVCRLDALITEGGIYLDTDVIAFKSLGPFRRFDSFLGMMFDDSVGTAVMGARPGSSLMKALRARYDSLDVGDTPNNDLVTGHLIDAHPEFVLRNVDQLLRDGTAVFQKEYFERFTRRPRAGFTRHLVANTWHDGDGPTGARSLLKQLLGPAVSSRLAEVRTLPRAAFFRTYVEHSLRRRRPERVPQLT